MKSSDISASKLCGNIEETSCNERCEIDQSKDWPATIVGQIILNMGHGSQLGNCATVWVCLSITSAYQLVEKLLCWVWIRFAALLTRTWTYCISLKVIPIVANEKYCFYNHGHSVSCMQFLESKVIVWCVCCFWDFLARISAWWPLLHEMAVFFKAWWWCTLNLFLGSWMNEVNPLNICWCFVWEQQFYWLTNSIWPWNALHWLHKYTCP